MSKARLEVLELVVTECHDVRFTKETRTSAPDGEPVRDTAKMAQNVTGAIPRKNPNDGRAQDSKRSADVILGNIDPFSVHGTPAGM